MRPRHFPFLFATGALILSGVQLVWQGSPPAASQPAGDRVEPNCGTIPKAAPVNHFRQSRTSLSSPSLFVSKNLHVANPVRARADGYVPVRQFTGHPFEVPRSCVILRPYPPGGLGDQLYRYAYAYSAARDLNTTLYIVRLQGDEGEREFGANDREFALDNFKLDSSRVQFMDLTTFNAIPGNWGFLLDEFGPWHQRQLPKDKIVVVTEFWQSQMYFERYEKEIRGQFELVDSVKGKSHLAHLVHQIEETESVAVHVRRGDFQTAPVRSPYYRALPISYQIRAIELMFYLLETRREPDSSWPPVTFFVFSDDIEWTRNEMADLKQRLVLVHDSTEKATSIEDFELMSLCKHNIIPNSGFGWWSAWLNPNPSKLVIAPFPRHRRRFYAPTAMGRHRMDLYWNHTYPANWLTLNPFTGYEDMG